MQYRQFECDGRIVDELVSGDRRLWICRTGAEPVSLAVRDGGSWIGFLHRDGDLRIPASGWANHATVMGYFLHRLWKEESIYRGHVIRGGNHGFLRHFEFAAPELLPDGLAYRVQPDQIPAGAYPLKAGLELRYLLGPAGFTMEFVFTNHESELPAHVSFGLHPGFAVESLAHAEIEFPPGDYVRHFAPGNFLDGRTETISFAGGEAPIDRAKLKDSYLLGLEGVASRHFRLTSGRRRVTLDFSEVPYVTLWSDAPDFLCIEPCWGLPDSQPPVPFEQKAGIQVIPPGLTLARKFSIQTELLP